MRRLILTPLTLLLPLSLVACADDGGTAGDGSATTVADGTGTTTGGTDGTDGTSGPDGTGQTPLATARCEAAQAAKEANARFDEVTRGAIAALEAANNTSPQALEAAFPTFTSTMQAFVADELPGILAAYEGYASKISSERRASQVDLVASRNAALANSFAQVTTPLQVLDVLQNDPSGEAYVQAIVRVNTFTQELCGFPFVDR